MAQKSKTKGGKGKGKTGGQTGKADTKTPTTTSSKQGTQSGPPEKSLARQCTAKSKRTGKRCGKRPLKGQKVCQYHGGNTQAAKAAGARREAKREALEQAGRLVQKDGVDMDPIDHLLDSLHRASQLVNVYGIMCAEVDGSAEEQLVEWDEADVDNTKTRGEMGYEIVEEEVGDSGRIIDRFIVTSKDKLLTLNKHSEAQIHPYLQAYTTALNTRAKFAKMCIDAGIAEMQMELVERQVDMAQEALEATLAEMKFDKKDRTKFMKSHARNLRDIGCRGSSVASGSLVRR